MSFRTYVVQARLERAHYLLEETNYPIGQIAEILGYQDVFLFSRQFKRYYGFPPNTCAVLSNVCGSVQKVALLLWISGMKWFNGIARSFEALRRADD